MRGRFRRRLSPLKIARSPETFGAINGKRGVLAWRTDKQERERALANVPALSRNLALYSTFGFATKQEKYRAEEQKLRTKLVIDIPALSSQARQVLTEARDAIGRKDVQNALQVVHADSKVRAELERFSKAVTERFGERTFLAIGARDANGAVFNEVAAGMAAVQREDLRAAWNFLRTIQKVAADERLTLSLKQAVSLRQTRSQGLSPR